MTAPRVHICPAGADDEAEFLAAAERSRAFHHPWVQAPKTPQAYQEYLSTDVPQPLSEVRVVWNDVEWLTFCMKFGRE